MMVDREAMANQFSCEPKIAIIIPVYQHSVLVAEAIVCALNQDTEIEYVIILVNDGCKFAETDRVCCELAIAYPQQIVYLYRPNGGLSAARNTGIDFALNTWNSVGAIYFLDADNRISPQTIERSWQVLLSDPELGWVYPTIDMFGKEEEGNFDYRGEYSVLRHLRFNICEAGSLIRREVFEAGCRYDELMRLGFEDWEFWWQAIGAGYRGQHLPESGFQYRKRFASMLSNSERNSQSIKEYMQKKHQKLLAHQNIMRWEQQEAPRYAIFLSDTQSVILTSDPVIQERTISLEDFLNYYYRGRSLPVRYHRSYFLVFTNSLVLKTLQEQALIHNVFWQLEYAQQAFAYLSLSHNSQDTAITMKLEHDLAGAKLSDRDRSHGDRQNTLTANDHLIMTTVKVMDECLLDEQEVWIESLATPEPLPKISQIQLRLPAQELASIPLAEATDHLLAMFKFLRWGIPERETQSWDWHQNYFPSRALMFNDARLALNSCPVYPRLTKSASKQIGFMLSILEFGGVEKVALNLAKVFHDAGWQVHLFVFGERMQQLPDWARVFSTINFYYQPSMNPWQGNKYMGTKNDPWSIPEEQIAAKSLLCWLDVAINFHNASVNNIMGQLRQEGVTTIMSLHVHDLSPWNRPVGYGYLTLGYEHVYDLIMPCSDRMADWCHSMGIPEEKITVVHNAGGYPLDSKTIAEIIARKTQRQAQQRDRLRVLYLGRFDRQKGLDRLVGIIDRAKQKSLPIEWKLVGKNILQEANHTPEITSIAELIEPPALTSDELNRLYEWADVLLLPSRWEGLPLTILEAMRVGVVICASNVGAIAEVVQHQHNGLIVENLQQELFITQAIALLQNLITNPDQFMALSQAAVARAAKLDWHHASLELQEKLQNIGNI